MRRVSARCAALRSSASSPGGTQCHRREPVSPAVEDGEPGWLLPRGWTWRPGVGPLCQEHSRAVVEAAVAEARRAVRRLVARELPDTSRSTCPNCGTIMQPSGSCEICPGCALSSGCS
jgi:hypothetical protein